LSQNMTIVWTLLGAVGGVVIALVIFSLLRLRKGPAHSEISATLESSSVTQESGSKLEQAPTADQSAIKEVDIAVGVNQLKLSNIRSFTKFDVKFAGPLSTPTAGQWTLLLGDNGVGKSTILRALVLALADPDVSTAVLQTQKSPAPFIRRGTDEGKIDLRVNGNLKYTVKLTPGSASERLQVFGTAQERPGLFGYGPLRGSALGGSSRQVSFSAIDTVATLFDESAQLIHAETWLGQRQLAALQSRGGADEAFFEAVKQTLLGLLPGVESIKVKPEGVEMTGPEVGRGVPLGAVSDGYVGTIGWILDLIARWSNRYQRLNGRPPDGSIATDMRGIVVVDEMGLHLHPRWQTSVVKDVRDCFPNMSFIVTSHHPLLLLGARDGEIHVLRRDPETRDIVIEQANIPPGTTADQVLTGRWFNLPSTLDEDTKHLLAEHRKLLRAGKGEHDSKVAELEKTLRGRLGTFADTSIDRMALQVAAQVMEESESTYQELTPQQKEAIRQEMMEELRLRRSQMET
jgi:energy-coupling factor transporter ATP-binding protein EcfA2